MQSVRHLLSIALSRHVQWKEIRIFCIVKENFNLFFVLYLLGKRVKISKKVENMPLKNKIIIIIMLLGSSLFLYQGFSLLFHPDSKQIETSKDENASE